MLAVNQERQLNTPVSYRIKELIAPYNTLKAEIDIDLVQTEFKDFIIITDRENPGTSINNGIEYYAHQICAQLNLNWYRCVFIEAYQKSEKAHDQFQRYDGICFSGEVIEEYSAVHKQPLKKTPLCPEAGWKSLSLELAMTLQKSGLHLTELIGKAAIFKDPYSSSEVPYVITGYDGNQYYTGEDFELIHGHFLRLAQ
jgi:hypothetical protein